MLDMPLRDPPMQAPAQPKPFFRWMWVCGRCSKQLWRRVLHSSSMTSLLLILKVILLQTS